MTYQPLFNYLYDTFGVTAIQTEMQEIIKTVNKLKNDDMELDSIKQIFSDLKNEVITEKQAEILVLSNFDFLLAENERMREALKEAEETKTTDNVLRLSEKLVLSRIEPMEYMGIKRGLLKLTFDFFDQIGEAQINVIKLDNEEPYYLTMEINSDLFESFSDQLESYWYKISEACKSYLQPLEQKGGGFGN